LNTPEGCPVVAGGAVRCPRSADTHETPGSVRKKIKRPGRARQFSRLPSFWDRGSKQPRNRARASSRSPERLRRFILPIVPESPFRHPHVLMPAGAPEAFNGFRESDQWIWASYLSVCLQLLAPQGPERAAGGAALGPLCGRARNPRNSTKKFQAPCRGATFSPALPGRNSLIIFSGGSASLHHRLLSPALPGRSKGDSH
jgi:hypothetical protein